MDREMIRGVLDIIILKLFEKNDMYAYEMMKTLTQLSDNKVLIGEGTLYPALKRLEDRKYISSYWIKLDDRMIKRKYYKIEAEGMKVLNSKIKDYRIITLLINTVMEESRDE